MLISTSYCYLNFIGLDTDDPEKFYYIMYQLTLIINLTSGRGDWILSVLISSFS